jgi:hypothetical protein
MRFQTLDHDRMTQEISQLRTWDGEPGEFWPRLAALLAATAGAARSLILVRNAENGAGWKRIADQGQPSAGTAGTLKEFLTRQAEFAEAGALNDMPTVTALDESPSADRAAYALSVRLQLRDDKTLCVSVLLLTGSLQTLAQEAVHRVSLLRDIPQSYEFFRENLRAQSDAQKFAVVLDLLAAMDSETRFLAAGLALTNAIADHFRCDRVSLGWLERRYVCLKVMSRTEHFDRRMAASSALEIIMEECLDQDEDVIVPPPTGATTVSRDHERYTADHRATHVASFPLRLEGKPVAVLTCERVNRPFTATESQQLRLTSDLVSRRLAELKRWDRWFGARWATEWRESAARWIGPEHTGAKILAVTIAVALGLLFFLPVPYRVEATFQLRSDEVAYLTGPYEGYIRDVHVRPGDVVAASQILLTLDVEELELEEIAAFADLNRFQREAEKAQATAALAEMRIADALAQQAHARLEMIRYRLSHAALRAPFASVVVEGDLRDRIGAPVKPGDALIRVARLDRMYIEAEVDQRDIQELTGSEHGQIAFVSQPRLTYPIRIERIEPAAVPRRSENVFLVRCIPLSPADSWWRPGMTGVCKLDAGHRSIAWIFTRRTADFLRLLLWW